jgi:hypothetical protein
MNLSKTHGAFWLFICLWVSVEVCFGRSPSNLALSFIVPPIDPNSPGDLSFTYFILCIGIFILLTTLIVLFHLIREKKKIVQEKEEQQRYFSNLIHEVIKGEAQSLLADVEPDHIFREHLCDFIKTCELGQTFVDRDNNDLFDLMKGMEFIYSNRLHSEISERYFYCEIDPSMKGIQLSYRQKYELIFLLRECLNNIRKYSGYKHTGLKIFYEKIRHSDKYGRAVILEIKDDGIGLQNTLSISEPEIEINAFNLSSFYDRHLSAKRCTGIVEIFRKAARMNGSLTLLTSQGRGTSIQLRFFPNSG